MTSFDTDGFLSQEIAIFTEDIRARFKSKLELSEDANRQAHQLIYSVEVRNAHLPDLLISTLLTRQAASFQGFLLLITRGLLAQAEILLRNIAESMFIVGAIRKEPAFADQYVLAEEVSRKKALARLRDNYARNGKEIDQETLDLITKLEERIHDEDIRTFTTERIAQIADLSDYYDTLYPLASMSVHTSTRGLDKALQTNEDGDVAAIHYGPITEGIDMHLDYAISMFLYTLHEVASHFERRTDPIEALQNRSREIAGGA